MEYRRLGKSGLQVSALSFGAWVTFHNQLTEEVALECMAYAYDSGVNFFDNAEAYAGGQAETMMGHCLKRLGWSRDSFIISSKVFWGGEKPTQRGLSAKHITDACHSALRRLQVDYLDLYFCHRPDPETPIEETVRAMDNLIKQGKILYWGTSEWSAEAITSAYKIARDHNYTPPTMEQPQYNLFHRERVETEYAALYDSFGLGTTIWSPPRIRYTHWKIRKRNPDNCRATLKGYEWLRHKIESEQGSKLISMTEQLTDHARVIGMSITELAIAWCLKNPNEYCYSWCLNTRSTAKQSESA